jgi:5-methylcytosine-specific restriction endonuclease McrA
LADDSILFMTQNRFSPKSFQALGRLKTGAKVVYLLAVNLFIILCLFMTFGTIKATTNRTICLGGLTTNLIKDYSEKAFAGNLRFPIRRCFGSAGETPAKAFSFGQSMTTQMKICSICKIEKHLSEYYKDVRRKDGLYARCKQCHHLLTAKHRKENPELHKKYYKTHREKYRESRITVLKNWRKNNSERVKEYGRKYNREMSEVRSKYRQENPDKCRAQRNNYVSRNRARRNSWQHNYRVKKQANGGTYTQKEWLELCNKFGNKCLCCGQREKLTVDHIIPISKGGQNTIANIQPLCAKCNSKKGAQIIDFREEHLRA